MENEQWLDVPEWKGFYQVSDCGRVRSVDRWMTYSSGNRRLQKGRILKPSTMRPDHPHERMHVTLQSKGYVRYYNVHRLVMLAFVGPRPNGLECCHNDGDRFNNRLSNLRYDTPKANNADQKMHGRGPQGEGNPRCILGWPKVREIRRRLASGEKGLPLSREYGVHSSTIYSIKYGKNWPPHTDPENQL